MPVHLRFAPDARSSPPLPKRPRRVRRAARQRPQRRCRPTTRRLLPLRHTQSRASALDRGASTARRARSAAPAASRIAQTIDAAGLDAFYDRRSAPRTAPATQRERRRRRMVAAGTTRRRRRASSARRRGGHREVSLLLEGIHCGACIWLIESWLCAPAGRRPGERQLRDAARPRRLGSGGGAALATLLRAIAAIGYRAYPVRSGAARGARAARVARAAAAHGRRAARDDAGDDVRGADLRHRSTASSPRIGCCSNGRASR